MKPYQTEDDFVLTISDHESQASDLSESLDIVTEAQLSKKRKRSDRSQNPSKKRKNTDTQHDRSENDESDHEEGVEDVAIDSDFEFDLLETHVDNVTQYDIPFTESLKQSKRGVNIGDIIARRAAKKHDNGTKTEEKLENPGLVHQTGSDEDEDEEAQDSEDNEMLDFEDEELLADDAFGAQAALENEDSENTDSNKSHHTHESASASDDDDDDESVASPTAHPDDAASDSDDETSSQISHSSADSTEVAKRKAFFAAEQPKSDDQDKKRTTGFHQLSLSRPLMRALTDLSFTKPTPIQDRTIPVALQGLDVVGSAQTGSGKTAAFLLPILERLLFRSRKIPTTRVAILMPTRELAVQCYTVATALARYTDITFAQIVGGFSVREQEVTLKKRPDIVIATPGRFIDHMRNSIFQVEKIEILVLDEADRMLEDGFADELDEILKTIPRRRQTMLFSATMTDSVDKLVRLGMDKPVRVSVDAKRSTVEGLTQEFARLRPGREQMRLATLCLLCNNVFTERTIVFFRQKKEAHRVRIVFGLLGIEGGELHGSMSQEQRITAVNAFRDGKTTHLLATDLASRGLDIKNVMSVINYEAPQSHEIYLHRVGRTARAGRSGRSCTIAAETDRKVVKAAVKAARSQGAKIVSRTMDLGEVDAMHVKVEGFEEDIEAILKEEKEEKAMAQAETQITRGENLVKHEAEIMSRPRRTWFEGEKEKLAAKHRGRADLNGTSANGVSFVGEKKKLSNKDKKRLDDRRERLEGRLWKKTKGSAEAAKSARTERKAAKRQKRNSANEGKKTKGRK